jgi:hypothetical protein
MADGWEFARPIMWEFVGVEELGWIQGTAAVGEEMHGSASYDKFRTGKVAGCADVVPVYVTEDDGVDVFGVEAAVSEAGGRIGVDCCGLPLGDVMLLGFSVA